MKREEILALSGMELNKAVAVNIFGYRPDEYRDGWVRKRYSEDMSAAWEVEEAFKDDMSKQGRYVSSLKDVLGENSLMFDFIHATPAQRCKAALLAVLEEGETNE